MRAFLSWLLCAVLLLGTTPVVAQQTNIQGGGASGCSVSGTANQIVSNTGSSTCQASAATADTSGNIGTAGTILTTCSGSAASPCLARGQNGFYFDATDVFIDGNNIYVGRFSKTGSVPLSTLANTGELCFESGGAATSCDLHLTRSAAATLHLGAADAAAPTAQVLGVQSVVTATSNIAGANWTLQGSKGTGTGVGGSIILQTAPASTTGSTPNTLVTAATIDGNSHVNLGGAAPAITLCGTGSPSVSGTDTSGTITVGTAAITCTLTFKVAYAAAPHCVISDQSLVANLTSYTVSTTAIVLTTVSNSGNLVNYVCVGL